MTFLVAESDERSFFDFLSFGERHQDTEANDLEKSLKTKGFDRFASFQLLFSKLQRQNEMNFKGRFIFEASKGLKVGTLSN